MRFIKRIVPLIAVSAAILFAQADPPGRAARLNYVNGPVSFQPAGVTDWVDATINRPLTTGDHIWAGDGGQVEIHAGSTALRLSSNTAFQFLNLDDQTAQIQLSQGTLTARVRNFGQGQNFEVDTPSLAFTMLRPGEYRIDANPDTQTTTITVRDGDGEVTGGGQTFPVHARQQAIVTGGDQITYDVEPAPGPDAWDQWSSSRDRREDQSQSARYVSREVPGYEDLDQYGQWSNQPGYGQVWRPNRVEAGWAPYHDGHWAWVAPWGWTWVDDAPWGYAPYHYGRWASFDGNWGWVPGPFGVTPVYAPALVGWVGGGGGGASFSLGFSFGNAAAVGWFPLGPRDPYIPSYNTSQGYFTRVNNTNTVINNTTINNYYNDSRNSNNTISNVKYVNQNVPNAVTAVPQNTFANGRSVAQSAHAVPAAQLAAAHFAVAPAIAPQQASVLGSRAGTAASAPRPPVSAFSRPVVARTAPPPPPVPFARQQSTLAKNPGRPLPPAAVQQVRQSAPAPTSPVRVVNMSQVQRVQPTIGAGPQGANRANTAPAVAQQPNAQSPNAVQRPGTVSAPAANNRPGAPPPSNTAQPNSPWSAPVARPGVPPSNANVQQQNTPPPNAAQRPGAAPPVRQQAVQSDRPPTLAPPNRPQNAPTPTIVQRPNTVPAPASSNPPSPPQPSAGAKPSPWSAPVARPGAPPSNDNVRQQNAPPPNAVQRSGAPPPVQQQVQSDRTPAAQPNRQQNAPPPTIVQRPNAVPPPAENNRANAPPPNRQPPVQSERAPQAAPPNRPQQQPPQPQRSQPVERTQESRPQAKATPHPAQADSKTQEEKPAPRRND
jgi:hypothetical protein